MVKYVIFSRRVLNLIWNRNVDLATRWQHSRDSLRYSTDPTDAKWAIIEPLLPSACRFGRPRLWSMREILNGISCVLRGGISWRLMPKELPPKSTVYGYFSAWRDSGLFAAINHHLVLMDRERAGERLRPVRPCSTVRA